MIVLAQYHFDPVSIWACVFSALCLRIVRFIFYTRVMVLDSCKSFYFDIQMLTSIPILMFKRKYAMLGRA